ncbi:MAG: hypothetical protein K8S55_06645 [Phycisphaerae bacterium]|nr:hypothetical protein [Phycisphaerae bacterium]
MSWIPFCNQKVLKKIVKRDCRNMRVVGFSNANATPFNVSEAERACIIASFKFPEPIILVFEYVGGERGALKSAYLWTGKNRSPMRSLNDKRVNLLIDEMEKLYEQEENVTVGRICKLVDRG